MIISGGDSYTRLKKCFTVIQSWRQVHLGDTKLKCGADAEFSFIQKNGNQEIWNVTGIF